MKKSKIIVPALGLIALSTAASITGTVAWFTANNSVTITGMTFKTQVGNNLLVADDSSSSFTDSAFGSELKQVRKAKLEPVSSVDGVDFYYTTVSNDNGSIKANSQFFTYNEDVAYGTGVKDTDAEKTNYDDDFNAKYIGTNSPTKGYAGTVVYGYVDYTFYLKGTFSASGDRIVMNKCNMLYNGAALTATDKAWRVAVFAVAATANTVNNETTVTPYTTAMSSAEKKTILTPAGAANFTANKAVDSLTDIDAEHPEKGKTEVLGDVTYNASNWVIYQTTAANESNKVFKVVVRLWLEGEDTKCYVDNYKSLTSEYTLEVGFTTEAAGTTPSAAVTGIGSSAA